MDSKVGFIKIDDTKYHFDEDIVIFQKNNIVYVEVHGEQTSEMAKVIENDFLNLVDEFHKGPRLLLVNLNDTGGHSSLARKVWKKISEDNNTMKIGLFGMHPVARVLASFVMGTIKNSKVRFFVSREEAENWLLNKEV